METNSKYLLPAAMFLIGALVLSGTILWYGMQNSYSQELDVSEGEVVGQGTPPPESWAYMPAELAFASIGGIVLSVGSGQLTVESDDGSGAVTILVNADTEMFSPGREKDPLVYEAELKDFNEKMSYGNPDRIYFQPEPFERINLSLTDIQPGTYVLVDPKEITAEGLIALRVFVDEENVE